jgi:hypothetical protein
MGSIILSNLQTGKKNKTRKDDRNLDTVRGSDDPRVGEQGGATLVLELPVLVLAQGHLYIDQFSLCNHSLF